MPRKVFLSRTKKKTLDNKKKHTLSKRKGHSRILGAFLSLWLPVCLSLHLAQNTHTHLVQLLDFVTPIEDGVTGVQLDQDAAQGPHVDGSGVREAQHHLGAAVEPRLDVLEHL